ncbi:MAG: Iron-sulfur cluster insertion protein ErpA [Chlamydiia bacterium]|nr:Iron-sulfur cluster insertion protein ErpA [Chlamydiia bacterium]MCH9615535.1 Iron-sulfur cluster insertion protein ErpA [Chlamydiia bacterium]MCH9629190.1 Iron-sulfur cluster insertion protein ErpA [Chlamydiia bacterium]
MIEEIINAFPNKSQKLIQALTNAGLHCVGCSAATFETLEAGMFSHGFEDAHIEALLETLNKLASATTDTSTISFTEKAAKKFKEILKQDGKEGWGLRFGDKPGGCGGYEYILDFSSHAEEDDVVIISHDAEIHINKKALSRLLGSEIDYQEGLMGSGFKVTNPNVKSSCSCGSSQSY